MKQYTRYIIPGEKFSGTIYEDRDNTIKICMSKDSYIKINGDHRGFRIWCIEGILWITQKNDFQDHILALGEIFVIDRKGLVIVSAFADICISLISL